MNAKQKRQLATADTAAVLDKHVTDERDYASAPSTSSGSYRSQDDDTPPIGIRSDEPLSHDSLEVIASSADIRDTDPVSHLHIQIGERVVNGKYEVRIAYRVETNNGEPFRAINSDKERAYRGAAKITFQRMRDHDAKTFEVNPFAWTGAQKDPPYQAASPETIELFTRALTRRVENKYGPRKS